MNTIGEKIRIQRVIKGYSQEYMGFALNISQPAYSKIERNETELTIPRIYEIAEILEISPFILMPVPKYGLGINYLKLKRTFYLLSKFLRNEIQSRKAKAQEVIVVHSDKPNI